MTIAQSRPTAARRGPANEAAEAGPVVLLVEDEALIRWDLAEELRQLGCQVIEAGNAEEAIALLRSTARIDIVLTDIDMPGPHDGLDVAQLVRAERPGTGIVLTSGRLRPVGTNAELFDLFLPKPASTGALAQALRDVTARRQGG